MVIILNLNRTSIWNYWVVCLEKISKKCLRIEKIKSFYDIVNQQAYDIEHDFCLTYLQIIQVLYSLSILFREFNFVSGWYVHILHCHYETHTKHKINLFWNTTILQQVLIDAISESIAMSSGAARVCVTYTNLEMAEIKFNVAIL